MPWTRPLPFSVILLRWHQVVNQVQLSGRSRQEQYPFIFFLHSPSSQTPTPPCLPLGVCSDARNWSQCARTGGITGCGAPGQQWYQKETRTPGRYPELQQTQAKSRRAELNPNTWVLSPNWVSGLSDTQLRLAVLCYSPSTEWLMCWFRTMANTQSHWLPCFINTDRQPR